MQEYIYSSKLEALSELLEIEGIPSKWPLKHIDYTTFLELISKNKYTLKELGLNATNQSKLTRCLFPDKPSSSNKICFYVFKLFNLKHCPSCHHIYDRDSFHNNRSSADGKNIYCIDCFNLKVKDLRREYVATRKAGKLLRTPLWADLSKIKEIYKKCPVGMHVDHVIPLQGLNVSGLHVEYNLQYLTAQENIKKSNKYMPE